MSKWDTSDREQPQVSYSDHLARHFKAGHPPRWMVEPMHQGHGKTVDDYYDVDTETDQ